MNSSPSPALARRREDQIFDRTGRVPRPSYAALLRELRSLAAYHPAPPDVSDIPPGRGHVVLVVPAFLTSDFVSMPLRSFLARCGYRAYGWNLGINWGPTPRILAGLRRRVDELSEIEGGPISLIGVSLGGVLSRDVVYDRPDKVRRVITLVSPYRLPTASAIAPLFRLCSLSHDSALNLDRLATPLPVPARAILTHDDGIVAWQSCGEADAIAVDGQHLTICRNPQALRALAENLADPR